MLAEYYAEDVMLAEHYAEGVILAEYIMLRVLC